MSAVPEISVKMVGMKALTDTIDRSKLTPAKKRIMFRRMTVVMDQWAQKNFESGGKHVGGWVPLKPLWAKGRLWWQARRKKGGRIETGAQTLMDTGRGRGSIKVKADARGAKIYSGLKYMSVHQRGRRDGSIPARQFIPDYKHVRKRVLRIALHAVTEEMSKL